MTYALLCVLLHVVYPTQPLVVTMRMHPGVIGFVCPHYTRLVTEL